MIEFISHFWNLAHEELLYSLQANDLIRLEMWKHDTQKAQSFFSRNGNIIECFDDNPNLLIDSINCLLLKKFFTNKFLENLANAKYHFIHLSVSQHFDKGLFEVLEDHRKVLFRLLFGQQSQEV